MVCPTLHAGNLTEGLLACQEELHIMEVFLLPTDAKEICFQRSIKIYIKITTAPTCFGVITIIRERTV